jgi:hypothetical protein
MKAGRSTVIGFSKSPTALGAPEMEHSESSFVVAIIHEK